MLKVQCSHAYVEKHSIFLSCFMCTAARLAAYSHVELNYISTSLKKKMCRPLTGGNLSTIWASVCRSQSMVMSRTGALSVHRRLHDKCGMTANLTLGLLVIQGEKVLSIGHKTEKSISSWNTLNFWGVSTGHTHIHTQQTSVPGPEPCQLSKDLDLQPQCQIHVIKRWTSWMSAGFDHSQFLPRDGAMASMLMAAWPVLCRIPHFWAPAGLSSAMLSF